MFSTDQAEITEFPHEEIEIISEKGEIKAIRINGYERKINSDEAEQRFLDFKKKYNSPGSNHDDIFKDSRRIMAELIDQNYAPVFTIPKEYLDEIIRTSFLIPHETSFDKRVILLAGTLGIRPFNLNGRYMAVVVSKNYRDLGLQPRYTIRAGNTLLFQGVVATERSIPLIDVVIIDPKTHEVIYPPDSAVKVTDREETDEKSSAKLRRDTESAITQIVPETALSKERITEIFKDYEPESLMEFFERIFPDEYRSDVESIDKDNLSQHTLKVLKQFEKYFSFRKLPLNVDRNLFRLVLALHDLGKPKALKEKNKDLHHKYSAKVIEETLGNIGYSEGEIALASTLVSKDPIGSYLKRGNLAKNAEDIIEMADKAGVNPSEFFELLVILFLCDASSYTEDAGSKNNLDNLFEFDRKKGTIDFSLSYLDKIYNLLDEVERINPKERAA